jgi:hypothetical protein
MVAAQDIAEVPILTRLTPNSINFDMKFLTAADTVFLYGMWKTCTPWSGGVQGQYPTYRENRCQPVSAVSSRLAATNENPTIAIGFGSARKNFAAIKICYGRSLP